ncbi:unnamed protein product [Trichobilharzia regenti]|uniref:Serine/threonine-protein kinase DDB_G0282963 n=1 Tax=Trichobilharzia regenti TaxID=157069 RepID=A0A183W614_TRIRE|nr:unnamed protein product [Trichobilharzia regenti]VDQ03622.1 unnamed protein product [Trichobilharzia regenti]
MDLTEFDSSCNNELTSSALKLVMEISINKLRNFQNTLQSPVGQQPMKAAATENRNISVSNNNGNSSSESMPRVTSRRTSSTFSPSNRLYRVMVILKIAKKARSILLTQEAMNTLPTNVNNDNNNNSVKAINNHDTLPSERISTSHSDSGEQCNLLNAVKSTTPLPINSSSEMPVLHSTNPNEQRYKRISDCNSDDSSVTSNKRVFDSNLSIWTPENPVLCNPESQEEQLRNSHDCQINVQHVLVSRVENDNDGVKMEDENTTADDEVDTEGSDEDVEDDDEEEEDDEDEGADSSTPNYQDQYSLSRCRMIVQPADIHTLENNRTTSTECLRSSNSNALQQQVSHTMDYNEMNHDCGRDMCICLSNSPNSRPLITGII